MTHLEQFKVMLGSSVTPTPYQQTHRQFQRGMTPCGTIVNERDKFHVVQIDPSLRTAYSFIFKDDGSFLVSEPSGY